MCVFVGEKGKYILEYYSASYNEPGEATCTSIITNCFLVLSSFLYNTCALYDAARGAKTDPANRLGTDQPTNVVPQPFT